MKTKETRVNIDVSLDEIKEFYIDNINLMGKLLEAARLVGETLDVLEPICKGDVHDEDIGEEGEEATSCKDLRERAAESLGANEEDVPEERDSKEDEEAEALATAILKAVFQAVAEAFDEE